MAFRIFLKISGQVDLAMLINFTLCQIFDICNGFGVISQKQQFTHYVLFIVTAAMLFGPGTSRI